ncbi:LacI family DNA-binding transcriptional regulator [Jiangella endophytica]|uniref:LacI family DNA-binding transcriptional regulator n=1 Tax=Jiangella endophytica TaxID=1623398 RepID=UPI000E353A51|nr:LacI family DNA-binding transcriptional regulator [Jiangella endophytica]
MPQRREAVTIADVARTVGVATSTVSRALNQPGRISDELRDRIVAAAATLGYHPNPQARSLTSGRTQSIALLVPDITNPFFFGLIRGAQAQARARGHRHVLVDTEESAEVEALTLAELPASVDGIVLAAARLTDAELTAAAGRVPLVLVNREVPGLRSVVMDTAAGALQALDHLVSLGHRSVAYVAGPATSWSSRKRWRALQRTARRLGVDCVRIGPFPPTMAAGAAAADAVVHHRVTGALFFNDLLAIGALRRFAERGIRVPDDLSVVGCDDIFGADFCRPPLTTLTTPVEQTGRVAVDMLLSTPTVGEPVRAGQTLPTHLTIRESTGPVPTRRAGRP